MGQCVQIGNATSVIQRLGCLKVGQVMPAKGAVTGGIQRPGNRKLNFDPAATTSPEKSCEQLTAPMSESMSRPRMDAAKTAGLWLILASHKPRF